MHEKTPDELVGEVVIRLIGVRNALRFNTILGSADPGIDTSKPNIHDNKADFLRERDAVVGGIEKLEQALLHMMPDREDSKQAVMINRLADAIDKEAAKKLRPVKVLDAYDLAMRNIVQTGFYYNSMFVMLRMVNSLKERLKELQDQEAQFWSVSNRPPNYYARTIALRLARLYAREKGHAPTFGTSRDGGHPSTDFGRSLEEIYHILGIKARVSNAAKWAIAELTEQDTSPGQNALEGGLLGLLSAPKPTGDKETVIDELANLAKKGS